MATADHTAGAREELMLDVDVDVGADPEVEEGKASVGA
jgi:hypothetical protein